MDKAVYDQHEQFYLSSGSGSQLSKPMCSSPR
jgi:hypothetical protein